jgi:signal transduction histidine kinase
LEERFLHALALRTAACSDVERDLPLALGTLQNHLSQRYTVPVRLCLALGLPQAPKLTLVAPPDLAIPAALNAAVDYQLRPGDQQQRACISLHCFGGRWPIPALRLGEPAESPDGWLLLLTPLPGLDGDSLAHRLAPLCQALKEGLSLCLAQQQRLHEAIEQERREFAAELHDSLSQELGYLRLLTARLEQASPPAEDPLAERIAAVHGQTQRVYRQTRELINSARITLADGDLPTALARTVAEFEQRSGLVYELDDRTASRHLPKATALQVLLIIREALCNSVRHAHASHVRIQLLPHADGGLRVRVDDNGQGLSLSRAGQASFGLSIMRERARKIGACLHLGERPGGGTRVELRLDDETGP